jgi:hypothetical protein
MKVKRKLTRKPDRAPVKPVTASEPCPICGGTHKCSITKCGLILCGRQPDAIPDGYQYRGQAKGDPQWGIYVPDDGPDLLEGDEAAGNDPCIDSEPFIDWGALSASYREALIPALANELADILGVTVEALERLDAPSGCQQDDELPIRDRRQAQGRRASRRPGGEQLSFVS